MAHGILTGIGFLCGGVIFREGFNVRGLTTAASLWTTATLGMLFGIGFYELAIFGGVATLAVLAAVAITERYAPQRRVAHVNASYSRSADMTLSRFADALAATGLKFITIDQKLDGETQTFSAIANGYSEIRAEALAASWSNDPATTSFHIRPQQA